MFLCAWDAGASSISKLIRPLKFPKTHVLFSLKWSGFQKADHAESVNQTENSAAFCGPGVACAGLPKYIQAPLSKVKGGSVHTQFMASIDPGAASPRFCQMVFKHLIIFPISRKYLHRNSVVNGQSCSGKRPQALGSAFLSGQGLRGFEFQGHV